MSAKTASWLTALTLFGVYFAAACLVLPFDEVLKKAVGLTFLATIVAIALLGAAVLVLGSLETLLSGILLFASDEHSSRTSTSSARPTP